MNKATNQGGRTLIAVLGVIAVLAGLSYLVFAPEEITATNLDEEQRYLPTDLPQGVFDEDALQAIEALEAARQVEAEEALDAAMQAEAQIGRLRTESEALDEALETLKRLNDGIDTVIEKEGLDNPGAGPDNP